MLEPGGEQQFAKLAAERLLAADALARELLCDGAAALDRFAGSYDGNRRSEDADRVETLVVVKRRSSMAMTALIKLGEISASGTSIRCSLPMVKTSRSAASKRMFALATSENARSSFLLGMLPIKSMTNQPNTAKNSSPTVAATFIGHGRDCQVGNVIAATAATAVPAENVEIRGQESFFNTELSIWRTASRRISKENETCVS